VEAPQIEIWFCMDQQDHALDHLLLEESIVPIVVDDMDLQLLSADNKYLIDHLKIYN
jgi:hypothetical protein